MLHWVIDGTSVRPVDFNLCDFFFSLIFDFIIKNFLFVPVKCVVEKAVTETKQFLEARENHFFFFNTSEFAVF